MTQAILEEYDGPWPPPSPAEIVTELIREIDNALIAGDMATFNASLTQLVDVSPDDARDVMRILGNLMVF